MSYVREFTPKETDLLITMSTISISLFVKGWEKGLEYQIWKWLTDPGDDILDGNCVKENLEVCKRLSKELGGWITWKDDDSEEGLPIEKWGFYFVPMSEWLNLVERHNG